MWMRIWRRMRRLQGSCGSGGQVMNQESDAREVGADGIVSPPCFLRPDYASYMVIYATYRYGYGLFLREMIYQ